MLRGLRLVERRPLQVCDLVVRSHPAVAHQIRFATLGGTGVSPVPCGSTGETAIATREIYRVTTTVVALAELQRYG